MSALAAECLAGDTKICGRWVEGPNVGEEEVKGRRLTRESDQERSAIRHLGSHIWLLPAV